MLPISIKIEGLNSYAEAVNIDFREFYKNHIFGIFGDTGSGKSTILDAIILSIYGKTPRLGKGIKEAINPSKKQINIDFDFSISNKQYRITRNIGEKSKVRLYEVNGPNSLKAVAEKEREFTEKIRQIIGLSEEEFYKVVILPQNQFAEILRIDPSKRAELIGSLFDLNLYGEPLFNIVSNKLTELKNQREQKEKGLEELKDLSEESIQNKEKEIQEITLDLEKSQSEQKTLTGRLQMIKDFIQLNQRLKALQIEIEGLEQRAAEMNRIKERLRLDESLSDSKIHLRQWLNLKERIKENKTEQATLQKQTEDLQKQLDKCNEEKNEFEASYNKRQIEIGKSLADIEHCIDIKNKILRSQEDTKKTIKELSRLLENKNTLEREINALSREIKGIEDEIKDTEKTIKDCELSDEERLSYDMLPSLLSDLNQIEYLTKEIKKITDSVIKKDKEHEEVSEILKKKIFTGLGLEVDNPGEAQDILDAEVKKLRTNQDDARQILKELEIKDMALSISGSLRQGVPCPVCGSLEHPNPASGNAQGEISHNRKKIEEYQRTIKLIEQIKTEIKGDCDRLINIKSENAEKQRHLKEKKEELLSLQDNLKKRLPQDKWQGAKEDFDRLKAKKEALERSQKTLITLKNLLKDKSDVINIKSNERTKLHSDTENKNSQIKELQRVISEHEKQLYEKTSGKDPIIMKQEIEDEGNKLNTQRESLQKKSKNIQEDLNRLKLRHQEITTALQIEISRHEELLDLLNHKAHQMKTTVEDLKDFFIEDPERQRLKEEVAQYETSLNTKSGEREGILRQIKDLPIKEIEPEEPQKTESRLRELLHRITEMNQKVGAMGELIKQQRRELEEKKALSAEIIRIRHNYNNAERLRGLIKGKEMVKFISRYLLTDIVRLTNEYLKDLKIGHRFHVNVNNNLDFTITDIYYNNERPVATLSGGETFILSFALALALSNFIQGRRQRSIDFFFIDEGFSSLDKDLLDSVGTVLNQLSSQKRLVGLISHLEELKQLIPTYINVQKDRSDKSVIRVLNSY